jgi:hypothetical protein
MIIAGTWCRANLQVVAPRRVLARYRVVVCRYVVLIGIAAVVGSLHPDEKIRADAQKVLERLLGHGRCSRR